MYKFIRLSILDNHLKFFLVYPFIVKVITMKKISILCLILSSVILFLLLPSFSASREDCTNRDPIYGCDCVDYGSIYDCDHAQNFKACKGGYVGSDLAIPLPAPDVPPIMEGSSPPASPEDLVACASSSGSVSGGSSSSGDCTITGLEGVTPPGELHSGGMLGMSSSRSYTIPIVYEPTYRSLPNISRRLSPRAIKFLEVLYRGLFDQYKSILDNAYNSSSVAAFLKINYEHVLDSRRVGVPFVFAKALKERIGNAIYSFEICDAKEGADYIYDLLVDLRDIIRSQDSHFFSSARTSDKK